MSVLNSILSKIFGHAAQAQPATSVSPGAGPASPVASGASAGATPSAAAGGAAPTSATVSGGAATSSGQVDVAAVLDEKLAGQGQKLDWRHSIVDLMKLLGLDSGLPQRKDLAKELGYTGDTNDSAAMNVWLHKQVMRKLAENGGKVPAELHSA